MFRRVWSFRLLTFQSLGVLLINSVPSLAATERHLLPLQPLDALNFVLLAHIAAVESLIAKAASEGSSQKKFKGYV